MKKQFLSFILIISGLASVSGQHDQRLKGPVLPGNSASYKATMFDGKIEKHPDRGFSLIKAVNPTVSASGNNASRGMNAEQTFGRTTFDNQSNGSMMRRIVNSNGKLSVIWTFSNEEVDSFPKRGVAYNFFDGAKWVNMPAYDDLEQIAKIEPEGTRTGFASILNIPGKGEVIFSHRTDTNALQITSNNNLGNQNWKSEAQYDLPLLWPRVANGGSDGKTIHLIGIATNDTLNGIDLKFDGMSSALLYSRSLDEGNTWGKKNILLPGIDSTKFRSFSADAYAIDAKGNNVAFVYGALNTPVYLFKSTDNGDTWTSKMIRDFPIVPWDDQVTDFNKDGDVLDTVQVISFDTLNAEAGKRPDSVDFKGNILVVKMDGTRKYIVSGNDTLDVVDNMYVITEELVNKNDTLQVLESTYVVFPPTDTVDVEEVAGRKFVVYNSDTLDVQSDQYVVRTIQVTMRDSFDVKPGSSFRFVTVTPGQTVEVTEAGTGSFIIIKGDTFTIVNNTYFLVPGDTTFLDERPFASDGSFEVLIDGDNKVHVWFGNMRISNDKKGDGTYSYYPATSGIMYWNENFAPGAEPRMISNLVDDDGDNELNILVRYDQLDAGGNINSDPGPFPYGSGQGATTTPTVAVDGNGKLYLFYQAYKEGDQYQYIAANGSYGPSFRHIYVITSSDNGKTWSSEGEDKFPVDLTESEEAGFDAFTEYAFPSVAKVADDYIHLTYMSDEAPGTFVSVRDENYHPINNNRMVYLRLTSEFNVSTKEILVPDAGLSVYPNPANNFVNINLELRKTENVAVRVCNLLGKVVLAPELRSLPAGKGALQLNTEGLSAGIYLINVQVGAKTYTEKVIISK